MTALMLILATIVAAPEPKVEPKKQMAIVGEWTLESMTMSGRPGPKAQAGTVYVFTDDGKFRMLRNGKEVADSTKDYTVNLKTMPMQFTFESSSTDIGGSPPVAGIFKIEGDTLMMAHIAGQTTRPKDFDTGKGSRSIVMVYKRVTKKK